MFQIANFCCLPTGVAYPPRFTLDRDILLHMVWYGTVVLQLTATYGTIPIRKVVHTMISSLSIRSRKLLILSFWLLCHICYPSFPQTVAIATPLRVQLPSRPIYARVDPWPRNPSSVLPSLRVPNIASASFHCASLSVVHHHYKHCRSIAAKRTIIASSLEES